MLGPGRKEKGGRKIAGGAAPRPVQNAPSDAAPSEQAAFDLQDSVDDEAVERDDFASKPISAARSNTVLLLYKHITRLCLYQSIM
jgi:hypothetical protein